ncbi:MAG: hypothetical protein KatS3mg039_0429 [Candidatus Kapaibacterium sp.]|nr:MAG: hypothetical protein KatS3mg039_0429 [Candidatus Kapabacteria bacterium]
MVRVWIGVTVLLICALGSVARADHLWANGTPRGVVLVWSPPSGSPLPHHYTIYRAVAGTGRWVEIATVERPKLDSTLEAVVADLGHPDLQRQQRARSLLLRMLFKSAPSVAMQLGISFEDTTTTPLAEYDYQIWAGSLLVAEQTGVVSHQHTPPPPPRGLAARQRSHCIELWWNLDSTITWGIAAFTVYRAQYGKSPLRIIPQPIAALSLGQDTTITGLVRDCSIRAAAGYTYYVAAIDLFGNEGIPSHVDVQWRPTAHRAPTIAEATSGNNQITCRLVGFPPTDSIRPIVRLNTQQRCILPEFDTNGTIIRLALPESTADAVALALVSGDSTSISWASVPQVLPVVDSIPPNRPVFSELERNGNNVRLRWLPTPDADLAGYLLERTNGPDTITYFVHAPMLTFSERAFDRQGIRYRLRTVDAHGNMSVPTPWASVAELRTLRPELLAVTRIDRGTLLAWNPLPWAARMLINRYEDTLSTPITIAMLDGRAISYVDPTTEPRWYELVAIDSIGNYSLPSRRLGYQPMHRCIAPAIDSVVFRDGAVMLFWSQANSDLLLERSTAQSDDVVVLAYLDRTMTSFRDELIKQGMQYTYRLRCIGKEHTGTSVTISIPP